MKNRERQCANRKMLIPPRCDRCDCACNRHGACFSLSDNIFGDKNCPFFKTSEQNEAEKNDVLAHLKAIGRGDLIDYYYGSKEAKAWA